MLSVLRADLQGEGGLVVAEWGEGGAGFAVLRGVEGARRHLAGEARLAAARCGGPLGQGHQGARLGRGERVGGVRAQGGHRGAARGGGNLPAAHNISFSKFNIIYIYFFC